MRTGYTYDDEMYNVRGSGNRSGRYPHKFTGKKIGEITKNANGEIEIIRNETTEERRCIVCDKVIDFVADETTNEVCSEKCNDAIVNGHNSDLGAQECDATDAQ